MMHADTIAPKQALINNTHYHFQDVGAGSILLLIHGSLCDYRYWRWQVAELAQHFRVIAPSLRFYWPTDSQIIEGEFSYQQHASDMKTLLDHLGVTSCHVLGHSRGATVAMQMALHHPEMVQSLILADPGLRTGTQLEKSITAKKQALQLIQTGELEQGLQIFVDSVSGAGTYKRMVRWFREMVKDNANTLFLQRFEPPFIYNEDLFATITLPVTLIGGSHSPAPFPAINQLLAQVWPQANNHILSPASHGMNLALPHEFNQCVIEAIQSLS